MTSFAVTKKESALLVDSAGTVTTAAMVVKEPPPTSKSNNTTEDEKKKEWKSIVDSWLLIHRRHMGKEEDEQKQQQQLQQHLIIQKGKDFIKTHASRNPNDTGSAAFSEGKSPKKNHNIDFIIELLLDLDDMNSGVSSHRDETLFVLRKLEWKVILLLHLHGLKKGSLYFYKRFAKQILKFKQKQKEQNSDKSQSKKNKNKKKRKLHKLCPKDIFLEYLIQSLSQSAFVLPIDEKFGSFLTDNVLTKTIWMKHPNLVTSIMDNFEIVNPYIPKSDDSMALTTLPEGGLGVTGRNNSKKKRTTQKKKPVQKKRRLPPKRQVFRGSHFHTKFNDVSSVLKKSLPLSSPTRSGGRRGGKNTPPLSSSFSSVTKNRFNTMNGMQTNHVDNTHITPPPLTSTSSRARPITVTTKKRKETEILAATLTNKNAQKQKEQKDHASDNTKRRRLAGMVNEDEDRFHLLPARPPTKPTTTAFQPGTPPPNRHRLQGSARKAKHNEGTTAAAIFVAETPIMTASQKRESNNTTLGATPCSGGTATTSRVSSILNINNDHRCALFSPKPCKNSNKRNDSISSSLFYSPVQLSGQNKNANNDVEAPPKPINLFGIIKSKTSNNNLLRRSNSTTVMATGSSALSKDGNNNVNSNSGPPSKKIRTAQTAVAAARAYLRRKSM